jgi:hypothetical protein
MPFELKRQLEKTFLWDSISYFDRDGKLQVGNMPPKCKKCKNDRKVSEGTVYCEVCNSIE